MWPMANRDGEGQSIIHLLAYSIERCSAVLAKPAHDLAPDLEWDSEVDVIRGNCSELHQTRSPAPKHRQQMNISPWVSNLEKKRLF